MSLFKGIKNLFGGGDTGALLNKAADGIYNGIDKLVYTDEEKAESLAKGRDLFLEFAKTSYDLNTVRSVTRRWLAFMVVGPTMFFFIMAAILYSLSLYVPMINIIIDGVSVHPMQANAQFLFDMAKTLVPWAGGVLVFYFGPHMIGALPGNRKG